MAEMTDHEAADVDQANASGEARELYDTFSVPGSGLGTLTVAKDGDIYCQKTLTTFNKANVNKYNF